MGWSTELFCNLSFNKKTYNSLLEVENDIDEINMILNNIKSTLRQLAYITEPEKFYSKDDYDSPGDYIESELSRCLDELDDYYFDLVKLEYLRDNWRNCHDKDGFAIEPPTPMDWETAYITGDFIRTRKNNVEDKI